MIIKAPSFSHLPQLQGLWQEAFHESMQSFLITIYSEKRCLIAEQNGQVAAALYWFDLDYQGKSLAYLYAIATSEKYRGQGIGKALVEKAHSHLKALGYAGTILVPADEGLFSFYKKCGYEMVIPGFSRNATDFVGEKVTWQQYAEARKSLLPPGSCQPSKEIFQYLDTYCDFYVAENACLCISREGVCQEALPYTREDRPFALFLPFEEDLPTPQYFALPMN